MALHNILSQQLCCHFAFLTTGWSNRNSTMWSTIHSSYEVPPWWLTTAFSAVVIWMHLYKGPVRIHLSQANSWKKDMQDMSKKLWNASPQHWGTQSSSPDNPKEEQAQLCHENKRVTNHSPPAIIPDNQPYFTPVSFHQLICSSQPNCPAQARF